MKWLRKICCQFLRLVEREEMDEAYRELLIEYRHAQRKCQEAEERLLKLRGRIIVAMGEPWE
jgi:hypothetical protein